MKPRRFDYVRPDSADEAVAVLAEYGEAASVLAGGQSLMAMLNLRLAEPAVLMDWPELAGRLPLLAAALPFVGHFQTRNKGTVCGSIAHADPSSEIPLVLATLGGEVVLRSHRGARVLAAADFQRGALTTAREPDE